MAIGFILRDAVSDTGRLLQEKQAEVMNRETGFFIENDNGKRCMIPLCPISF
jgi:hypothetical protein